MLIELLGVLEDGRNRDLSVPTNVRTAVRVPRGANVTVRVRCLYPDGSPVNLTGSEVVLTLVKTTQQRGIVPPGFQKTASGPVSSATPHIAQFAVTPADTAGLAPGTHVFDVWLVTADDARYPLVPASAWVVETTASMPPA